MNSVVSLIRFLIKGIIAKNMNDIKKDALTVDKWIDIMKDKILMIRYSDKGGKVSNSLSIASYPNPEGGPNPRLEFTLEEFFRYDDPLIIELQQLLISNNLGDIFMLLKDDYKLVANHFTGEILLKKKLTIPERIKYKSLWKKLYHDYTKNNKK